LVDTIQGGNNVSQSKFQLQIYCSNRYNNWWKSLNRSPTRSLHILQSAQFDTNATV